MSSIRITRGLLLIALGVTVSASGQNASPSQSVLGCPGSILVSESGVAHDSWKVETGAPIEHRFLRPSIFNGTPGKEEYDLAPDGQHVKGNHVEQVWTLTDYRDRGLFLRCRYQGTQVTLSVEIPPPFKTCSFSFRNLSGNQPVSSPVFECRK
jgi:hypothetical protein